MKKSFIAAALLLALSAPSWATNPPNPCGNHGNNCNPTPTDPADPSQSQQQTQTANGGAGGSANQGQAQGQAQGQGQTATGVGLGIGQGGQGGHAAASGGDARATGGDSSSTSGALSGSLSGAAAGASNGDQTTRIGDVGSTSGAVSGSTSNSGGNRLDNASTSLSGAASDASSDSLSLAQTGDSTSAASADGSGNSSVTVDAADRSSSSYVSQALWLPEVQTAAPAYVASPNVQIVQGVCGPRVERVSERASGTYVGIIKRTSIDLGNDDVGIVLAAEPFKYHTDQAGNVLVEGSRVDYAVAVIGIAASRGIGLGGGETGGNWANGGVSSNSSIQRPITRALITPCLLPAAAPVFPESFKPRIPRG